MNKDNLKMIFPTWDSGKGIHVGNSDFFLSWSDPNIKKIASEFGGTHTIEVIYGMRANLLTLSETQSVCSGDSKTYHFLLTPISG